MLNCLSPTHPQPHLPFKGFEEGIFDTQVRMFQCVNNVWIKVYSTVFEVGYFNNHFQHEQALGIIAGGLGLEIGLLVPWGSLLYAI